jgi:F420-non-reducing hydrogenase large subunit
MKFCYLKPIRWKGFVDGAEAGSTAWLRWHAFERVGWNADALAQVAYEQFSPLGGKPVHHTLALHWARMIEMLCAAERMKGTAEDPDSPIERAQTADGDAEEGIGVIEASSRDADSSLPDRREGPDPKSEPDLATQHNAARMAMSVEKAAKGFVTRDKISDGVLNMVEMAFRAYDPCLGCATHSLPGSMPLFVRVRDASGATTATLRRDNDGSVRRD